MESPWEFDGALLRAAMQVLKQSGLSAAMLEMAGPAEERRIEEVLARATGLDAAAQQRLRGALVAAGDDVADVVKVRSLAPEENVPGAVEVGQSRFSVERQGERGAEPARKKRPRARKAKPIPALVTIVRASEKQRAAPPAESRPAAETAPESPAAPARRALPAGKGRFTSGGRLEGGGAPGATAWSRPPGDEPSGKREPEGRGRPKGPNRGPRGGRGRP